MYIPVDPNSNYRIEFWTGNPGGTADLQYTFSPNYNLDNLLFNQSYLTMSTSSYPLDAFMILKLSNINDTNDIIGISPNSNNYSSLSYSNRRFNIKATSNSLVSSINETSENYLLLEWSIGNNNNYIRRFGSNIANTTVGTWNLPNNSNIIIGNSNGFDFSNRFKGYIGELIMFNRQLNNNDTQQIEGYLAWKWGLQFFLASNHAYKNSPPYLFKRFIDNTYIPTGVPSYYTSNSGFYLSKTGYASIDLVLSSASTTLNAIRTYSSVASGWTQVHDKDLDTNVYYSMSEFDRQLIKIVLNKGVSTFTTTNLYTLTNATTSVLGACYAPSCLWTSTTGYGAFIIGGFGQAIIHVLEFNSTKTNISNAYTVAYTSEVYGTEVIPKGASGFLNNYGVAYTRNSKQMSSWVIDMSTRSWTNRVDNSYSTSPAGTINGGGMIYYPPGKEIFSGDTDIGGNRIAFTNSFDSKLYVWNISETNNKIDWTYSKTIILTNFGNGPTPYHMSTNAYNSIS